MPEAVPSLPGWQLVWHDEFDRDGLPDSSKWDYDTEFNRRGWWNRELQYYSRERLENTRVAGGKLIITARRQRLSNASDFGRADSRHPTRCCTPRESCCSSYLNTPDFYLIGYESLKLDRSHIDPVCIKST